MLAPNVVKLPATLDEKITHREQHLVAYQNKALAKKYRAMVDGISDVRMKEAVAKGYHKLLSYKDEYEVARLHLDTVNKAKDQFEDGFDVAFHLAPPLLSKEGSNGRPQKREFGAGMIRWFKLLARLKSLRGTPLDLFGRTEERKMERALIAQYESDMAEILKDNSENASDEAIALAELPLQIRGFGPVKAANEAKAAKRREEILAAIRTPNRQKTAAE